MHRVHADCFIIVINVVNLLWMLLFGVQFYMLILNSFFLLWSAYRVVLFSAFALIQGGKNSASCAISLAEESLGPCLTINNHLLQRSSLQSNLCLFTAFYISLSRCLYRDVNLQCLFSLYLPAFPFPLPSPVLIHLCSHVLFPCWPVSRLLCACSRGHSVSSADIVHCFFAIGGEAAREKHRGELQLITLCTP